MAQVLNTGINGKVNFTLPAESVVLFTVSRCNTTQKIIGAAQFAPVAGGINRNKTIASQQSLQVQLNEGQPELDKVSYVQFDLSKTSITASQKIILKVVTPGL